MLFSIYVKGIRGDWENISMMKYLMHHAERLSIIVNHLNLVVKSWTTQKYLDLYNAVNNPPPPCFEQEYNILDYCLE